MSKSKNKPLSASRIKTLNECSWIFWCKYHLKLPDKSNDGSSRGTVCHAVFECLGNPRHRKHFDDIVEAQSVGASPAVKRMILSYAKKLDVHDFENLDLINRMIIECLNYDFFGDKNGKPTKDLTEEKFDISVDEDGKKYRILGFIDRVYLFKKERLRIIRDYKTSKSVFSGKDLTDNIQDLMYRLAVKKLYPEFAKTEMEFLFVKFDLESEGCLKMPDVDDDELEGFEYFLTEVQKSIDNFSEENSTQDMASDRGYPSREEGFEGLIRCGRAEYEGQLKKDGNLMWHCPFKFAYDYYKLLDKDGNFIKSSRIKDELLGLQEEKEGSTIEKLHYDGCPSFKRLNKKPAKRSSRASGDVFL